MIYNENGKILNQEYSLMEFMNTRSELDDIIHEYLIDGDKIFNKVTHFVTEDLPKIFKTIIDKICQAIKSAIDWLGDFITRTKNKPFIVKNKDIIKNKLDSLNNNPILSQYSNNKSLETIGDYWKNTIFYFESPGYKNGQYIESFTNTTNNFDKYIGVEIIKDLFPNYIFPNNSFKNLFKEDLKINSEQFEKSTKDWFINLQIYNSVPTNIRDYSDEIINYATNFSSIIAPLKKAHAQYHRIGLNVEKINGKTSVANASILHNYFITAMCHIRKLATSCVNLCLVVLKTPIE